MGSNWDFLAAYSNPVPADVPEALRRLGLDLLRDAGDELQTRCPMHLANTGRPDRHPSFWVNASTGRFLCFSCGYSGLFVQLVADVQASTREEALRWIARQGLYRLRAAEEPPSEPAPEPVTVTEASLALFTEPPADALATRHLTAEAAAAYGVLWSPREKRWIIPIRDPDTGTLLGWQEKGGHHFLNYPDGVAKSTTLFGYHTPHAHTSILVESPLDAVRLASLGITGAVASYGAYVSAAQMRLLRRRPGVLILALDNDTTGRKARDQIYRIWRPRGVRMRFLDYAGITAKDPGDMADEEIRRAVDNAYLPFTRHKELACSPESSTPTKRKR
ncbi:toprim domain-containing protein [Kitasatospora sp. NPDC052896]|uniref:toprim domain-containing protein n=1 Tax=Kitasatospora sp. NPDC052896 TaxID=3364061 RepID=UPI0037C7BFEC